jgi:hypothetical protein
MSFNLVQIFQGWWLVVHGHHDGLLGIKFTKSIITQGCVVRKREELSRTTPVHERGGSASNDGVTSLAEGRKGRDGLRKLVVLIHHW